MLERLLRVDGVSGVGILIRGSLGEGVTDQT